MLNVWWRFWVYNFNDYRYEQKGKIKESDYMQKEDIIEQLDRIERMLFTLLDETNKEKFKNEKIEKYKIKLNLYEKMLKGDETNEKYKKENH